VAPTKKILLEDYTPGSFTLTCTSTRKVSMHMLTISIFMLPFNLIGFKPPESYLSIDNKSQVLSSIQIKLLESLLYYLIALSAMLQQVTNLSTPIAKQDLNSGHIWYAMYIHKKFDTTIMLTYTKDDVSSFINI